MTRMIDRIARRARCPHCSWNVDAIGRRNATLMRQEEREAYQDALERKAGEVLAEHVAEKHPEVTHGG